MDVVDAATGLAADSAVALLRRQREASCATPRAAMMCDRASGSWWRQPDRTRGGGVACCLDRAGFGLVAHYQARLNELGADAGSIERWSAARLGTSAPVALVAKPGFGDRHGSSVWRGVGLSPRDIVVVTQIVAFVSYQVRVVAGLRALDEEMRPMTGKRFTLEPVEWAAWMPVVSRYRDASAAAALAASPQRDSPYFQTLAHDVDSLEQRSPLFHAVMYVPRGLPRADRELATVVVSIINGCVYCSSVHARRFAN